MFNIRRYARLIPNIAKNTRAWPISTPLLSNNNMLFSQQKNKPTEAEMQQIKDSANEFYNNNVDDIIELKSYEDWQTIVGGCNETMLIDFYADWCMPCKKLTPKLEEKVRKSGGKLKLLKINIDKFGKIAQTFQIKAVPTVYMVHEGKAVDAFSGELTDEQLDAFLQTAARASKGNEEQQKVGMALQEAKSLLNQRQYEEAEKALLAIKYNKVPEEFKLVGDIFLACSYSEQNKMAHLKGMVEVMKVNAEFYINKPEFQQLFGHMCAVCEKFDKEKEENTDLADWKKKIEAQPNNLELRYEAAQFYRQNQMIEECLDQLISIVKANKNWQDKQANKLILEIFKELGNSSAITQTYRRLFQQALH